MWLRADLGMSNFPRWYLTRLASVCLGVLDDLFNKLACISLSSTFDQFKASISGAVLSKASRTSNLPCVFIPPPFDDIRYWDMLNPYSSFPNLDTSSFPFLSLDLLWFSSIKFLMEFELNLTFPLLPIGDIDSLYFRLTTAISRFRERYHL